ncbi:MAG TPA: hypothetical protein VJT32_03260 [bacterium]|nr:hypothetical protein [bacterium]
MIQTSVVAILLIAGAVIAQANFSTLYSQSSITIPGLAGVAVTHLQVLEGVGAALLLAWLAGAIDGLVLHRQVRQRDELLHSLEQEMLKMKSTAYDQQQPALADIRGRLESLVQEVRNIMTRIDSAGVAARPSHLVREESMATGRTGGTLRVPEV